MDTQPAYTRPSLEEAVLAWQALLRQRNLPTGLLWAFDENLCFEKDSSAPGGFKLGFQTAFTPPPPQAERVAYEYFSEFDTRLVFYRIGSWREKSVCLMLCDDWFENKTESQGYFRHDDWGMSFRPGAAEPIEEVTDERRWKHRLLRGRPLHDLDFCLPLRAVHELQAHDRVLTTYERYSLRFLDVWKRFLHR